VDVTVLRCAAWGGGLRGVLHIDEDKARSAGVIAGGGADSNGIPPLLVGDDVVRTSNRKV
jgi:hypothetical protein